jgi:hypothetical protein
VGPGAILVYLPTLVPTVAASAAGRFQKVPPAAERERSQDFFVRLPERAMPYGEAAAVAMTYLEEAQGACKDVTSRWLERRCGARRPDWRERGLCALSWIPATTSPA